MKLEKILEKSALMFQRYGIRSVTMDDISKELSISKKTLYAYVDDKKDLVTKVIEMYSSKSFLKDCDNNEDLNAVEEFHFMYKSLKEMLLSHNPNIEFDLKKYYPDIYRKFKKHKNQKIKEHFTNNLKKGKEQGFYRSDINVEILSWWHILRMETLQTKVHELIEKENLDKTKVFMELIKYHFHAVATDKGEKEFNKLLKQETNA